MGSVFPLFFMLLHLISLVSPSSSSASLSSVSTDTLSTTDDKTVVNIRSARLLDLAIRDYTVGLYDEKNFRTGEVNHVNLPGNLSGIEVDTARFRCGSLRRYGGRVKEFYLRKGVMINPCVERVILIRQELGLNWSTIYYNSYKLQGYELVTPILGLLAYNGGDDYQNVSSPDPFELRIVADGDPIKVDFTNITQIDSKIMKGKMPYCANFEGQGKVTLTSMVSPHVCEAKKQGHIGLVIEAIGSSSRSSPSAEYTKGISRWKIAVGSSVGAALGVFLLGLLLVAMFAKAKKRSKLEDMVRRAYEEEALQVTMVGHVKAPTAAATRTVPIIEHDYRPPYF